MEILLLTAVSAANILCFMVGAKVGQAVSKGQEVKMPELNPVKVVQHYQSEKETKREQERYAVIMENIENYDGSSIGQKDVPRG